MSGQKASLQLISTGTSGNDSTLLSAGADGKNAFFFTRQQLVPEDQNNSLVRLYTAREGGGYPYGPPQFSCAASDECHGPGTEPPSPASVGTNAGTPAQYQTKPKPKRCRKGKVKRHGKCVKKPRKKKKHHKKHHRKHAKAKHRSAK